MRKTLANLTLRTFLSAATMGLGGLGCSTVQNMSTAEWISAAGTTVIAGAETRDDAIAGAVIKVIGDNQVAKEVAQEGKTEVNIYNQGQPANSSDFDYNQMPDEFKILPAEFVCNYIKKGIEIPEFDDVVGLYKTEFDKSEPITIVKRIQGREGEELEMQFRGYGFGYLSDPKKIKDEKFTIPTNDFLYKIIVPPNSLVEDKSYTVYFYLNPTWYLTAEEESKVNFFTK